MSSRVCDEGREENLTSEMQLAIDHDQPCLLILLSYTREGRSPMSPLQGSLCSTIECIELHKYLHLQGNKATSGLKEGTVTSQGNIIFIKDRREEYLK